MTPFYNPSLSYEDNYQTGPFGAFSRPAPNLDTLNNTQTHQRFGKEVLMPFGIPSGPLLNSRYVAAAFNHGFDFCIYKTVRTTEHPCHPLPNVLAIHPQAKLCRQGEQVLADHCFSSHPLSITNSFGVPSFVPDIWQDDMSIAVKSAGKQQVLAGSFQGTPGNGLIEEDYALAARLVAETGIPILEANLSCPNEGRHGLLCFDIDKVERIVHAIKNVVPNHPLMLKIAYFSDDVLLDDLIDRIGPLVDGLCAINTLSANPVTSQGQPALSPNRPEGGICGDAIRWAGLEMVQRLAKKRKQSGLNFTIIGVGGVSTYQHYLAYQDVGADIVLAATAAMWNPNLARDFKSHYQQEIDIYHSCPQNTVFAAE